MTTTTTTTTTTNTISRVADIPTATVQCHASNLLALPNGDLLCVWFGGTQEGTSDISIYSSRLPSSSSSLPSGEWTPPVRISSDPHRSEQNPVLFREPDDTGHIWLLHTAQPAGNQDQCAVVARTSADGGRTWGEPRELWEGRRGFFIRQPIVVVGNDDDDTTTTTTSGGGKTWVLPVWHCRVPDGYRWIGSDDVSLVWYSRDGGATWAEREVPGSGGAVHMNIVALPNNHSPSSSSSSSYSSSSPPPPKYLALYRSRWADSIYSSTCSSPDCLTWTPPQPIPSLPNPNAGICAAALPNGDVVAVFNDSAAVPGAALREGLYDDITPASDTRRNQPPVVGPDGVKRGAIWGTPRSALTVAVSRDGGRTWPGKGEKGRRVLQDGDGFCMTNNSKDKGTNRELSYPSIAVVGERAVHIAFTYWRLNIRNVYIGDLDKWLEGQD